MDEDKKNSLCRVCLNCDIERINKGLSIFEKYNDTSIADKINSIANVEISEGDGLPERICSECLLDLEKAIIFKSKCENSNVFLHTKALKPENVHDIAISVKVEKGTDYEYEYVNEEVSVQFDQNYVKSETPTNEVGVRKSRAIDLKLECHDCGGLFKSKCKLRVHWKKVHQQSQLICHNCKRMFKTFKALHCHLRRKTKGCIHADKFNVEGQGRLRVFHCRDCNYKSKRVKDLITHSVVHSGERPYICDLCSRGFSQMSSLQAHKESSHNTYLGEATCQYCGEHIIGRNRLYRHLRKHRNLSVECPTCHKTYKSKNSLYVHMKTHNPTKAYACEVCGVRFNTYSALYNHKYQMHIKNKQYKCDVCQYVSHRASIIKAHRLKHTGTNISCLVCGKFLDNIQQYKLHEKRHLERNHACQYCSLKFFSKKSLCSHIRIKHKCTMLVNNKPQEITVETGSLKIESTTDENQINDVV